MTVIGIITKLDQLKVSLGHQAHYTGTGPHRNKKKQPKGGKTHQAKKHIKEWL